MEANNLITAGLIFVLILTASASWFSWYVYRDAHRYSLGARKALGHLSRKLHKAVSLPYTTTCLSDIEVALSVSLMHFEDVAGKIKDDTVRAQLELSFMVVRATVANLPIRVCIDDTIFCFAENEYNHEAVLKSIGDFNLALNKLNKS